MIYEYSCFSIQIWLYTFNEWNKMKCYVIEVKTTINFTNIMKTLDINWSILQKKKHLVLLLVLRSKLNLCLWSIFFFLIWIKQQLTYDKKNITNYILLTFFISYLLITLYFHFFYSNTTWTRANSWHILRKQLSQQQTSMPTWCEIGRRKGGPILTCRPM